MILRIAGRYLLAKKSHKVVNVISVISIAGVAVATMAIAVVLSVFNGFTDLARRHLAAVDPDARIVAVGAKTFAQADSLADVLEALPQVAVAMPMLQERALLVADDEQAPVILRGLEPDKAGRALDLDKLIIDGVYTADSPNPDSIAAAQIAVGVAMNTGLRPSAYSWADIYTPRRLGRINPANPAAAYRRMPVVVSGVFRVDQPEYDADYVFVPIDRLRSLLEYDSAEATSLEVLAADGTDASELADVLRSKLPEGFEVLDRDMQQAETFRMISVEKWVTFLMLVFILIIASFNIVSTLSLMVIEKRDNMSTLRALGASRNTVENIFVALGWLITAAGGIVGTALGLALSLAQEHFGIIKLAADPSALTIDVYPVKVEWSDMALLLLTVIILGFLVAQISRIFTRKYTLEK
ncbi:MAG: ABC transporter permease [Muribaculaceae bacterium]|nr:ABC transporter permease [Muribaculaceae bacterium]